MNNELPKTKIDEKTGIEYHLEGDYYIPNLTMPKQEKITLNKYGRMRLNYLKEHKKANYSIMLLDGTLNTHLKEIQEQATSRVEQIIKQLKSKRISGFPIHFIPHMKINILTFRKSKNIFQKENH